MLTRRDAEWLAMRQNIGRRFAEELPPFDRVLWRTTALPPRLFRVIEPLFRLRLRRLLEQWLLLWLQLRNEPIDNIDNEAELFRRAYKAGLTETNIDG